MIEPLKPERKIFQVDEPPVRLDKYLAKELEALSRSSIQKLIEQGRVLVKGSAAKASLKVTYGDTISIDIPPPEYSDLEPESIPLDIVYEDADLIVIDKPAGMTVYPAAGHKSHTMVNALLAYYPDLAKVGSTARPGIVHRLDKDTSGLIVIAKNSASQRNLIEQFKIRSVTKVYLALVRGKLTTGHGIIEAPIGRDPRNRKRMAVVDKGREAVTEFRVKEYIGDYTLLEVTLKTGRTHQIRVHLSAIGYPVVGDNSYGGKSAFLKRQFLHAHRIGFALPSTGEYKEFVSKLPPDLADILSLLRQRKHA
jgi:23S rRNA pseudouridine1911/1915/1917 synthase